MGDGDQPQLSVDAERELTDILRRGIEAGDDSAGSDAGEMTPDSAFH